MRLHFGCTERVFLSLRNVIFRCFHHIARSTSATCSLDPIPTQFVKMFREELIHAITFVINESFDNGCFPDKFKCANICPKLKGTKNDPEEIKNYRPIANLKFFAKIVEKVAALQLQEYLKNCNLHAKSQSGYRSFHSVETAMVRVSNDILMSLDKGEEVVIILLDFSSAFDTIKHDNMLKRASHRFGISGKALDWIKSYLTGRTHTVVIGKDHSSSHVLSQGVPQGSVMGPILFTMYTSPLESLIDQHGVNKMFYADDTQLYVAYKRTNLDDVSLKLSECMKTVKEWSRVNGLKLNGSKTEFLHISSHYRATVPITSINLDGTLIQATETCRNLGVTFNDKFTMEKFVAQKCRSASFALHRIGKIRSFLDKQTAERLVHAFVMCHIDFCNSLLQGLPAGQIKRLQTIQNSAARLVSRTKKYQSISPVLQSLHWLPVHYRIMFKILLLSYQCFHNLAPSYLTELLTIYKPGRNLRSGKKNFFVVSPVLTKTYGVRTFAHAAPIMWNNLPDSLRSLNSMEHFKSALKTYLFQLSLIS